MTTEPFHSDTTFVGRKPKNRTAAAVVLLLFAAPALAADRRAAWPPFLPPPSRYATDLVAAIEQVWQEPTLVRRVRGRPARVPLDVYVAFVDAPEVTAAAARFLRLAHYEVEALGGDWYQATDHEGARGTYVVLARVPGRRVMLSWGEHSGRLLGTISGTALTVLEFEAGEGLVEQQVEAWVRIDQAFAAALARVLVPVFGHLADRKLIEGAAVAARVAEWAVANPEAFCEWLGGTPQRTARERLATVLPACRGQGEPGRLGLRPPGPTR
jgi:hypothetical protein